MGEAPFSLGYAMPAEWERHQATWLSWPKNPLTFAADVLPDVEAAYCEIAESLAGGETVEILVDDAAAETRVRDLLPSAGMRFHRTPSADVWIRDYGPIFVKGRSGVAATKWRFNAWGNKYDDLLPDDHVGLEVARAAGVRVFEAGRVLEGGSVDVNGSGMLLTTEQCLLNPNRNPGLRRGAIEGLLRDYLGATEVIWLKSGIAGDDTDGHVDDLARFVDARTVLCMVEGDIRDENHAALRQNQRLLSAFRDREGQRLDLVTLPMPPRLDAPDGRLPASYANFYVGNSAVLVPTFGASSDDEALATIGGFFKGRRTVGVDCRKLVYGFGGIHCVTQQQPA